MGTDASHFEACQSGDWCVFFIVVEPNFRFCFDLTFRKPQAIQGNCGGQHPVFLSAWNIDDLLELTVAPIFGCGFPHRAVLD